MTLNACKCYKGKPGIISCAVRLGQEIQGISGIADFYRSDGTLEGAVGEFDIRKRVGFRGDRSVLRSSVYFALVGNDNTEYGPVYEGLLNPEEVSLLGKKHIKMGQSRGGAASRDQKSGIFALDKKTRKANAKKAGALGGASNRDNQIGYCGLSAEERRVATVKSAESKGYIPWGEEYFYALALSRHGEYKCSQGKDLGRILIEVNRVFGRGRTKRSLAMVMNNRNGNNVDVTDSLLDEIEEFYSNQPDAL